VRTGEQQSAAATHGTNPAHGYQAPPRNLNEQRCAPPGNASGSPRSASRSAGTQDPDSIRRIRRTIDSRTCHEGIRAGIGATFDSLPGHPTLDLQPHLRASLGDHHPRAAQLGQHHTKEPLPTEPRLNVTFRAPASA